jgi:isoleucyl-tRNA synthetase
VRHPLKQLLVAGSGATDLADYVDLIADEVNVKEVRLTGDVSGVAHEVLPVVPSAIGPRLGAQTQAVIAAVKRGDWTQTTDGTVQAAGTALRDGEYTLLLRPSDEQAGRSLPGRAGVVQLDLETTDELEREGLSRDVVRLVQERRRDDGLHISDRIHLSLALPSAMSLAVEEHRGWVMDQTLAVSLTVTTAESVSIQITVAAA